MFETLISCFVLRRPQSLFSAHAHLQPLRKIWREKNYLWCCFALFVTSLTNNRRNPRSFSLHLAFPLPTTLAFCECTLNKLNVFKSWIRQFHHCSFSETKYRSTHQIVEANEETSLSKWPLDLSIIIYVNKSYNQCEGPNILGKLDVLKHKWCLVSEG